MRQLYRDRRLMGSILAVVLATSKLLRQPRHRHCPLHDLAFSVTFQGKGVTPCQRECGIKLLRNYHALT